MDNADRTRVRESLGRPSSSGSDGAPPKKYGPAAGQNRATLQGLENMRPTEQKFDINFTLPFARTTSGDRSCVVEALDGVRGPGTAGILADVKLSSEDTLAEYVSAQNLAHVRSRQCFEFKSAAEQRFSKKVMMRKVDGQTFAYGPEDYVYSLMPDSEMNWKPPQID
ncbi:hypothetical protein LTR09_003958 [Extremus antarcticus]|uniref:Uncharacterized protein n=1 Tax=Extremus antarcticus TaxID=702011 RepID=A0AAJ0DQS4_9PEZI|nr:hypothetical protein LTR09_003958 [Extremus antarcticus]